MYGWITHWFKNSLFEIFLFPPRIEMNFHNLFCSKKTTQSASTLAVCLLQNFYLFMSMQMLINTPPESRTLVNQNNGDDVNKVKGKDTKRFSTLLKIAKKGQIVIKNIVS